MYYSDYAKLTQLDITDVTSPTTTGITPQDLHHCKNITVIPHLALHQSDCIIELRRLSMYVYMGTLNCVIPIKMGSTVVKQLHSSP